MKHKNLPDDIKAKSLDELREILNSLFQSCNKRYSKKISISLKRN